MKKLITLMMIAVLCIGIVGCGDKKTDKKNEKEKEVTMADFDWRDCVISIDDNIIELPVSVEKLTEIGFGNFHCGFEQVEPGRTVHGTAVYKGGRYQLEIRNPQDENGQKSKALKPEKCEVSGIRVNDIMLLALGQIKIVLPENINLKETTIDDIIEKYGKQTKKRGDYTYVWSDDGTMLEIRVKKDGHGIVEGFYVSN